METLVALTDGAKTVGPRTTRRTLWENLSLTVASGERMCITGKSGSGKSTLLNCLGLLDHLDAGTLHLAGTDVSDLSERRRLKMRRHSLGYLFQDYALIDNESVRQNIKIATPATLWGKGGQSALSVDEALDLVGLGGRASEKVFNLSGGEQQRVAMARLMLRSPRIVLADEPTASLDRANATVILDQLQYLANRGAAVIMVSHDPWVVAQADTVKELSAEGQRLS